MKFFGVSYKNKNAGLSLLLAMVGSTIALSVAIGILSSVTRSLEQSQGLERSTQVFFAIESGLEAGFFHHNARGQGVSFVDLNDVGFPDEQTISHATTNIDTDWTINGRSASSEMYGLVYENTPLQLRWFWDSSDEVSEEPSIVSHTPSFNLQFDTNDEFGNFDFGEVEDGVLLSWMLTRGTGPTGVGSLVPKSDDPANPCRDTSFICRNNLSFETISSSDLRDGTLLPRINTDTTDTLDHFTTVGSNFQLIVTPLREFSDPVDGKIEGIPFTLQENSGIALPLPNYAVHTRISTGNFSKELSLPEIPELTSVQAFSYVIFD